MVSIHARETMTSAQQFPNVTCKSKPSTEVPYRWEPNHRLARDVGKCRLRKLSEEDRIHLLVVSKNISLILRQAFFFFFLHFHVSKMSILLTVPAVGDLPVLWRSFHYFHVHETHLESISIDRVQMGVSIWEGVLDPTCEALFLSGVPPKNCMWCKTSNTDNSELKRD